MAADAPAAGPAPPSPPGSGMPLTSALLTLLAVVVVVTTACAAAWAVDYAADAEAEARQAREGGVGRCLAEWTAQQGGVHADALHAVRKEQAGAVAGYLKAPEVALLALLQQGADTQPRIASAAAFLDAASLRQAAYATLATFSRWDAEVREVRFYADAAAGGGGAQEHLSYVAHNAADVRLAMPADASGGMRSGRVGADGRWAGGSERWVPQSTGVHEQLVARAFAGAEAPGAAHFSPVVVLDEAPSVLVYGTWAGGAAAAPQGLFVVAVSVLGLSAAMNATAALPDGAYLYAVERHPWTGAVGTLVAASRGPVASSDGRGALRPLDARNHTLAEGRVAAAGGGAARSPLALHAERMLGGGGDGGYGALSEAAADAPSWAAPDGTLWWSSASYTRPGWYTVLIAPEASVLRTLATARAAVLAAQDAAAAEARAASSTRYALAGGVLAAWALLVLGVSAALLRRAVAAPLGDLGDDMGRLAALRLEEIPTREESAIREVRAMQQAFRRTLAFLLECRAYLPEAVQLQLAGAASEGAGDSEVADDSESWSGWNPLGGRMGSSRSVVFGEAEDPAIEVDAVAREDSRRQRGRFDKLRLDESFLEASYSPSSPGSKSPIRLAEETPVNLEVRSPFRFYNSASQPSFQHTSPRIKTGPRRHPPEPERPVPSFDASGGDGSPRSSSRHHSFPDLDAGSVGSRGSAGHRHALAALDSGARRALGFPPPVAAGDLKSRRVALVLFNIANFRLLVASATDAELTTIHADFVVLTAKAITALKGVAEPFAGDRLLASFNGARRIGVSTAMSAAAQCAAAVRQDFDAIPLMKAWQPDVGLSFACAAGEARLGILGSVSMKKFTILSAAMGFVSKLEALNTEMLACGFLRRTGLVDQTMIPSLVHKYHVRMLGAVFSMKRLPQPVPFAELGEAVPVRTEEWMYQMEHAEAANPYAAWNAALDAAVLDDEPDWAALLAAADEPADRSYAEQLSAWDFYEPLSLDSLLRPPPPPDSPPPASPTTDELRQFIARRRQSDDAL